MDISRYQAIRIERDGRLLKLVLDNPPMNSWSEQLHRELSTVFYDAQLDTESDVLLLTGQGDVFSAGGDIPLMQRRIDDPHLMVRKNLEVKRIVFSLLELEKPLICRINGDAIGAGATLALLSDITIAVDTARIGDPHVRMGYSTGDGSATIWPQLIGYMRAKEYLLTGKLMSAPDAERFGLINYAVPADQLDEKVSEFLSSFLNGATKAIRWSKTSINIPLRALAHSMLDAALAYQTMTNDSADHQEAVRAFAEKRRPRFTGQ
ncbi:enoyl-CoA hydratase/isomerase family protein [Roseomonas terrae]|uniref:Enoyl-CoA hydratase/isomerase family protein n=1 Tax=Neoroseomonas terrae TaxID=424799 RepID=A0ABS5ELX4_9PROT|nr:enoyl-CoA hydratase-related protein [Neoroseomonas terrae]MBR0652033.1 enoyl-CoA hydratase/isomerase family protein [Neoroseomonas terrae]